MNIFNENVFINLNTKEYYTFTNEQVIEKISNLILQTYFTNKNQINIKFYLIDGIYSNRNTYTQNNGFTIKNLIDIILDYYHSKLKFDEIENLKKTCLYSKNFDFINNYRIDTMINTYFDCITKKNDTYYINLGS